MRKITIVLLLCLSCSPIYNIRITDKEYPSPKIIRQDNNLLVFMTISGGGTRAGTMGWRALEYLKKIPYYYTSDSNSVVESNLADQIDYISGISGGSFAATGWCIYKDSMSLFRKRFINENVQMDLIKGLFIPPWQGLRVLCSPYYSRINVAAEYYDKEIFMRKQFKDLPSHPVLWINATNLSTAGRFVFSPEQLNLMDTDLRHYPLGYACAASSAFPVLLNPITLVNYGEPTDLEKNIDYKMAKLNAVKNPEKYYYYKSLEFFNDKKNKWVHLMDGGLVDNQGLQAVLDQFQNNGIINKKLNDSENPFKGLVIINVNAGLDPDDKHSQKQEAPGLKDVMMYTMSASMDILSAKRWNEIRTRCDEIWKAKLDGVSSLENKPFCIEINFRNIKQKELRDKCYSLPTSFNLSKNQISVIDSAVPILMNENEELNRFINLRDCF